QLDLVLHEESDATGERVGEGLVGEHFRWRHRVARYGACHFASGDLQVEAVARTLGVRTLQAEAVNNSVHARRCLEGFGEVRLQHLVALVETEIAVTQRLGTGKAPRVARINEGIAGAQL